MRSVACFNRVFVNKAAAATDGSVGAFPVPNLARPNWGGGLSSLHPLFISGRIGSCRGMKTIADDKYETAAHALGATCIAGVDEVGRGPLAGPVTAAAVRLLPGKLPLGLADSKALTAKRRDVLFDLIMEMAEVSIAHASVEEIDALNLLRASHLAMVRALNGLPTAPDYALIDGNLMPRDMPCAGEAIVKGDALSLSIAAASIVAKVTRDRLMVELGQQYPGYGWDKNAGYPTKEHQSGLLNLGVTPHHRRSFKPVHNILYQDKSITR